LKVLLHQSSILPNKGDAEGKTALMIAVESENFEGVDACLRACVVPFVKNAYGQSALDLVEDIDDLNIKTKMKSRIEQAIEMWK
jgi:ankyrin repeat protein